MKSKISILLKLSTLIIIVYFSMSTGGCPPTPKPVFEDCIGNDCFLIDSFTANIKRKMTDSCMGYGFVVFYKDTIMRAYSNGLKRTQADGGPLNFDVFAKVQLASLSKTVTAISVLQILASKNMNTYTK